MKLVAHFYEDLRSASRIPTSRGATLRDTMKRPIDVMIEDLSATGFGMSTATDLPIGSLLNLRLAGIAKREVRVVRRFGLNYGCEFVPPLNDRELRQALEAGSVVDRLLTKDGGTAWDAHTVAAHDKKLAAPVRVAILFGTIASLWIAIIWLIESVVK